MTKKIVSCLFALVLLLGCVFPAAALEIHIDNSQALGGSLALRYLRTDGVWVTKGWVNFGPHSKQTVTLETWEPVFYLHVEVGGGAGLLQQRAICALVHRVVRAHKGADVPGIGIGVDQLHVARHGGDALYLQLRQLVHHKEGDCIIYADIRVEPDGNFTHTGTSLPS